MWKNSFTGRDITALYTLHTNISVSILVTVELFFSQQRPFLALLLNLGHLGHFVPASTYFLQHLLKTKKEGMMMKIQCHVLDFM